MEPIELADVPEVDEARGLDRSARTGFAAPTHIARSEDGRVVVAVEKEADRKVKPARRLKVRVDDAPIVDPTDGVAALNEDWLPFSIGLAADGQGVTFASIYDAHAVSLPDGNAEEIWRSYELGKARGVAWVDADTHLVLGEKGLALIRRGDDGFSVVHTVKVSKCAELAYLPAYRIAVVRSEGSKPLVVAVVLQDKIRKLLTSALPIRRIVAGGGMLFASSRDRAWMMDGAEAAAAWGLAKEGLSVGCSHSV